MARKQLSNLDMNKNQVLNMLLQIIAGDHATPVEGLIWYDSGAQAIKFRDSGATRTLGVAGGGVLASTWNANTLVKADTDDTPIAMTVAADTLVGRATGVDGGVITDLTVAEVKTLLGLTDELLQDLIGAMVTGGTETGIAVTYDDTNARFDFVVSALNALTAPTGDLSLNSHKIISLATPTADDDAATKLYVDNLVAGLSWKDAARVATTANIDLANQMENGDTLDGVTLATGDRVLVKNQTAGETNGIYVVQATGAGVRATDFDVAAEVLGAAVFVQEGTAGAGTAWVLSTDAPITLGTTPLTFAQFAAGQVYTAGDGLLLTGQDFSVRVDGSTIEISTDILRVKDAGITDAKLASTFTKKFAANVGDGAQTSLTVTHNLNTRDVIVSVHDAATYDEVICDVQKATVNTVVLGFAVAPASNAYRCTVIG